MPPKAELPNPDIDLAERSFDGLDVTLWWVKGTLQTYVTVNDHKTQTFFTVHTPETENAMHVFDHPFSFKADEHERVS